MFFKSSKVTAQWDTWCYHHDGTYYLYYLITESSAGEGFGVATSADGVHWDDRGQVLAASESMVHFLGTGSVWKAVDFETSRRFICNYSEWRLDSSGEKRQVILFAESKDLIHWEKLGDDAMFRVDERWYERYGRWDCIYAVPDGSGGYVGTWTATPKGRESLDGGIGLGHSADGISWEALPSPAVIPDAYESGAMEPIGDRVYAMFGKGGVGMACYAADGFGGPFRLAETNTCILASGHTYFSRFFRTPGGLLVNHHSMTGEKTGSRRPVTFAAPLKRAEVDDRGIFRLRYWEGNDAVRGRRIDYGTETSNIRGFVAEGLIAEGEAGLCLDYGSGEYAFAVGTDGTVRTGDGGAVVDRLLPPAGSRRFVLLTRLGMAELYLDGFHIASRMTGFPGAGRVRLTAGGSADRDSMTLFEMEDL